MMNQNLSREMARQSVRAVVVLYSLDSRSEAKVMERAKGRAGSRNRNHKELGYLKSIVKNDNAVDATSMVKLNEDGLIPYRVGNRITKLDIIRIVKFPNIVATLLCFCCTCSSSTFYRLSLFDVEPRGNLNMENICE